MLSRKVMVSGDRVDPNFRNVTLLLHGDGTNGSQNNTFIDSSVNNFTVTRNGNPTQGSFNPYSQFWSYYFDGADDYISASGTSTLVNPGTNNFTIEAWIYRSVSGAAHTIYAKGLTASGMVFQVTSTNTLRFTDTSTNNIDSTGTIAKNTWTHVAVVREGTGTNQTKLYINGVNDGQGTVSTNFTQTFQFRIGTDRSNGADFAGYISNFRLVNTAAVYTSNFTPPSSNLTAISGTALLTCQSNRFKDNSANNATITLNSTPKVSAFSPFSSKYAYPKLQGASGYFDGTGDYLSIADNVSLRPGAGEFTIEGWIYRNASGAAHTVFAKGGASTGVVLQVTSSNTLQFTDTTTNITSTGVVNAGAWNHVAVVRQGTGTNQTKLYINGVNDGQGTVSTNFTQTEEVRIGTNRSATENTNGYLCDVRLALIALYTGNFGPPTAPIVDKNFASLLCNFNNAGIFDSAAKSDLETLGNAQIDTGTKKFGTGSMEFDGTGDSLSYIGESLLTEDFTVEFWLYLNSTAAQQGTFTVGTADDSASFSIYISTSGEVAYYSQSNLIISSTSAVTTGVWYNITLARSAGSSKLFINGTQVGSTYSDTKNYTSTTFRIGLGYGGITNLNGFIDELRVTKGVARYTANFTPPALPFPDK